MPATLQTQIRSKQNQPPQRLTVGIPTEPICRISVEQYHDMIRVGILNSDDPIELLEGWLVRKMAKNPPHVVACELLSAALQLLLAAGWFIKREAPLSLLDSEPEPDLAIVRGRSRDYSERHPTSKDVGIVIEVADSSRDRDLSLKKRIYARSAITEYWVVNLPSAQIEVFSEPNSSAKTPSYRSHRVYTAKQKLPVVLSGKKLGTLLVADVLP